MEPLNTDERLADLISWNLANSDLQEQMNAVMLILSRCLAVSIAYVSTIDNSTPVLHASFGISTEQYDKESFCDVKIDRSELVVVEDTCLDKNFKENPIFINNDIPVRFYASYPLFSMLGNVIGTLCIADYEPRKLSQSELKIFKTIGKLLNERIRMNKLASLQTQIQESQKELEKINNQLYQSNRFYKQLFGQYMSESLLEKVVRDKNGMELTGEEKHVTVLISDIRGFSPIVCKYTPKEVLSILNSYLEEMIGIIHKHDGYLNEILGDGMLVIFGAPKHIGNCALKAVKCAQEMQQRISKVNSKFMEKGLPEIEMGIGINNGELIVGNIGSKQRMKYGVVGENINIASRIESMTIGGQILISESVYNSVSDSIKPVGSLKTKIKGFGKPVTIYDVSNS